MTKQQQFKRQLRTGCVVELEHTKNKRAACKIAKDHLREDARYYSKLCKIWPKEKGCAPLKSRKRRS